MNYHIVPEAWEVSPQSTTPDEGSVHHYGTPDDVRLFPPALDRLTLKRTSSSSIPIVPARISQSEIDFEEDMAMAEYREFAMLQRILQSKKHRAKNAKDLFLKHRLTLQHGHLIHEEEEESTLQYGYKYEQRRIMRYFERIRLNSQLSSQLHHDTTDVTSDVSMYEDTLPSEEGIFDLEM
jgi:hypothetical protein